MAKKDTKNTENELPEEEQEILEAAEDEEVLDDGSPEEDYEEEHEHDDEDEHTALSSRILRILAFLVIGAIGALWAGPKVAPLLPAGLKPVAEFLSPQADSAEQIAALQVEFEKRLTEIEAASKTQDARAEIEPLVAQLKSKDADIDAALATLAETTKTLETTIATLQAEVTEISARQTLASEGGQVSDKALKQFEDKLSAISAAQQLLNQSQSIATEAQQDAAGKLQLANATNAASRIFDALEKGRSFQNDLDRLTDVDGLDVPSELADLAASGAPALPVLKKQLPELARVALREDAAANSTETVIGKFTAFMKSQVGTRSLQPQDGDSLDAVLSRIEGFIGAGDLARTLAETDKLNDATRETMKNWITSVAQLNSAHIALNSVQQQLKGR